MKPDGPLGNIAILRRGNMIYQQHPDSIVIG